MSHQEKLGPIGLIVGIIIVASVVVVAAYETVERRGLIEPRSEILEKYHHVMPLEQAVEALMHARPEAHAAELLDLYRREYSFAAGQTHEQPTQELEQRINELEAGLDHETIEALRSLVVMQAGPAGH